MLLRSLLIARQSGLHRNDGLDKGLSKHPPLTLPSPRKGEGKQRGYAVRRAALASSERSISICSRYCLSSPVTYSPEKHEVSKCLSASLPSCTAHTKSGRSW